jgi:hypothetical protein
VVAGCGPTEPAKPSGPPKPGETVAKGDEGKHSGWWCDEHGVPEDECSLCSKKVAREAKEKGNWCGQHDCAKSHCFLCDPKLKEKFAARYRAKYGKEPPPTEFDDQLKNLEKAGDKKDGR